MTRSGEGVRDLPVFPERETYGEAEARLQELQQASDEIGRELARQLLTDLGVASDESAAQLLANAETAQAVLEANPPKMSDENPGFAVRYLYEAPLDPDAVAFPRLVYPYNSACYIGYVEGEINGVKPVMVRHPVPQDLQARW